jgi:hypothetical protein
LRHWSGPISFLTRLSWAIAVAAVVFASSPASGPASAAAAGDQPPTLSLGLAPVKTAFDLVAGESRIITATVNGGGNIDLQVQVLYRDALRRDQQGFEYVEPGREFWSAGSWLTVTPAEFGLSPGQRQTLRTVVTVPPDTPDGEYYAAFQVSASPTVAPADGTTVQVAGRLTSLIILAVGQSIPREARLIPYGDVPWAPQGSALGAVGERAAHLWRCLAIDDRNVAVFAEGRPLRVFVPLENTGKTYIQPRVTVTISQGDAVSRTLVLEGEILLSGDRRALELAWTDSPLLGRFDLEIRVDYGGSEPLMAACRVTVFPVKGAMGIVAMAFGVGYLTARWGRRRTPSRPVAASGSGAAPGR